jgi:hypothetical protein
MQMFDIFWNGKMMSGIIAALVEIFFLSFAKLCKLGCDVA